MSAWFMSLQYSEFKNFPITIERAAKVNSVRVLIYILQKQEGQLIKNCWTVDS
jgi:hypothetical protein